MPSVVIAFWRYSSKKVALSKEPVWDQRRSLAYPVAFGSEVLPVDTAAKLVRLMQRAKEVTVGANNLQIQHISTLLQRHLRPIGSLPGDIHWVAAIYSGNYQSSVGLSQLDSGSSSITRKPKMIDHAAGIVRIAL